MDYDAVITGLQEEREAYAVVEGINKTSLEMQQTTITNLQNSRKELKTALSRCVDIARLRDEYDNDAELTGFTAIAQNKDLDDEL